MEPFYFKSFDKTIGIACDVPSLYYEMKCQLLYDKPAIDYHTKEGHIAMWLDYIGEHDLAESIRDQKETELILNILEDKIKINKEGKSKKGGMHKGSGHQGMKGGQKHKEEMLK
jgi:hypothetical protein